MRTKKTVALVFASLVASTSVCSYAQGGSSSDSMATGKTASQTATNKSADRALQKRVRAALAKDRDVTVSNITVRARGGAITLEGSVADQGEVERAGEVAKGVAGVSSVKNSLTIRSPGQ